MERVIDEMPQTGFLIYVEILCAFRGYRLEVGQSFNRIRAVVWPSMFMYCL